MIKPVMWALNENEDESHSRGLLFAMCSDSIKYGRLEYDPLHVVNYQCNLELENCDYCGSPLSKFCRGQIAHLVYNPLKKQQKRFVCDLCIGFFRLDKSLNHSVLITFSNKISQKPTHLDFLQMIIELYQSMMNGDDKAKNKLKLLNSLQKETKEKFGTSNPVQLVKLFRNSPEWSKIQKLNLAWLKQKNTIEESKNIPLIDPQFGEIDKTHVIDFEKFNYFITETQRTYGLDELNAIKRCKDLFYKEHSITIRNKVKKCLFHDTSRKTLNLLNELLTKLKQNNLAEYNTICGVLEKKHKYTADEKQLEVDAKNEILSFKNEIIQIKNTSQNLTKEYSENVQAANEFVGLINQYYDELANYRTVLNEATKQCVQLNKQFMRLSDKERDQFNEVLAGIKRVDQFIDQATSGHEKICDRVHKYLSICEKNRDIVKNYFNRLTKAELSLDKKKLELKSIKIRHDKLIIIIGLFNQHLATSLNVHDLRLFDYLCRLENNFHSHFHNNSDNNTEISKLLSNVKSKIKMLASYEYDDKILIETRKACLYVCSRIGVLSSAQKNNNMYTEICILIKYIKSNYVPLITNRLLKNQNKSIRNLMSKVNEFEDKDELDEITRKIIDQIYQMCERLLYGEYEFEYRWWTKAHFDEYLTQKKLFLLINLFELEIKSKLRNTYLMPMELEPFLTI